jgi:hypothetical protein
MATEAPDENGQFEVVGCSTKTHDPDALVKLPSDPDLPHGHPRTKLKRDTYAVGNWIEVVCINDITGCKGHVPPSVYDRILDKIQKYYELVAEQIEPSGVTSDIPSNLNAKESGPRLGGAAAL